MREQQERLTQVIASELRAQKARLNATNEDIAKQADVTSMTISRYLTGERKIPVDVFWAICESLHLDGGALLNSAAKSVRQPESSAGSAYSSVLDQLQHVTHRDPIGWQTAAYHDPNNGVTRGAITFWDLPEPDVRVGHADGWKRETIEQWYEQHNEASRA